MRSLPHLLCPVRRILRSRHALAAGLLTCAIGLPLLACSKHPTRPIVRADSPTAVVQRFRTAWIERDTLAFRSCLAETFFGYGSACIDSTGHLFLQIGPGRDSSIVAAARLFRLGSASHPPAVWIDVRIDSFELQPGARDSIHERDAFGTASVVIRTPSGTLHLGGFTGFHLVRGDVPLAILPPDSTRWFIQNWLDLVTDETAPSTAHIDASWRAWQSMRERVTRSSSAPPQRATDSAGCDSLLRTTWGYALRRYLD